MVASTGAVRTGQHAGRRDKEAPPKAVTRQAKESPARLVLFLSPRSRSPAAAARHRFANFGSASELVGQRSYPAYLNGNRQRRRKRLREAWNHRLFS